MPVTSILFFKINKQVHHIDLLSHFQMFAVQEKTMRSPHFQYRCRNTQRSLPELLENMKKARVTIATILLQASSTSRSPIHMTEKFSGNKAGDYEASILQSEADKNPTTGGPEVLEVFGRIRPQPRALRSLCRLVIRRHLSKPILLPGNVSKLPVPGRVKQYVAMEELGFPLTHMS